MEEYHEELEVLVVDPAHAEDLRVLECLEQIQQWEVKTMHVQSANEVMELIESSPPDIVLMEYQLKKNTGFSLVRQIRVQEFGIPVVILTGDGDEEIAARSFRIGADDYRVKENLTPERLLTSVKYSITQRQNKVERKRAARFDELTNLFNRRFSFKRILEEMKSAVRHDQYFSLCLVDLDGFKSLNDQLGHVAGDYLLKRTAQLMNESVRADDIVGRYGGDEFLLGLRNTDSSGALRVAQKMTDLIESHTFSVPNKRDVEVKCCVGVAEFDGSAYDHDDRIETVEEFLDRADQSLYLAKQKGPGTVERRRYERKDLEEPVPVTVGDEDDRVCSSAQLIEYSRVGVRLKEAPPFREGEPITLNLSLDNGELLEEQGVIRSCEIKEDNSKAIIGVEVDFPLQLFCEENNSSSCAC